jgi:hypothetical protein
MPKRVHHIGMLACYWDFRWAQRLLLANPVPDTVSFELNAERLACFASTPPGRDPAKR